MKKKEYLILIALILIFSAYLLMHKENKDHYTLPAIEKIDKKEVTGLVLEKKDGRIAFTKKQNTWLVTDNGFPADSTEVETMLDAVATLKLSALVSQKGDLNRYDLDDDGRIKVTAMNKQKVMLEFTLGKIAPTANHTFVMLANDKNIYHASGSFRASFDKTVDAFRDKKVMEFKQASINRFTIEKDGLSKVLVAREDKKDKKKPMVSWHAEDGTSADKEVISNLLSALSFLECDHYLDDAARKALETTPFLCKIRLENKGVIELRLFQSDEKDPVAGLSSMSPYGFELSPYNSNEIVSTIETLLGIKKDKEK